MKHEYGVQVVEEDVLVVVLRNVSGRDLLHNKKRKIDQRPEESDDAVRKQVAEFHFVARAGEPQKVVVEQVVVDGVSIGHVAEEKQEKIEKQ